MLKDTETELINTANNIFSQYNVEDFSSIKEIFINVINDAVKHKKAQEIFDKVIENYIEIVKKEMEKELTHKESGGFYWADIQFHKDDIRDLQKVISWICERIKQIKE